MDRAKVLFVTTLVLSLTVMTLQGAGKEIKTFSKYVAPILFDKCVTCHRPDESAPMPLRSY